MSVTIRPITDLPTRGVARRAECGRPHHLAASRSVYSRPPKMCRAVCDGKGRLRASHPFHDGFSRPHPGQDERATWWSPPFMKTRLVRNSALDGTSLLWADDDVAGLDSGQELGAGQVDDLVIGAEDGLNPHPVGEIPLHLIQGLAD